jgi:hypothetical protein
MYMYMYTTYMKEYPHTPTSYAQQTPAPAA